MLFPFATAWMEVDICLAAKADCNRHGMESIFSPVSFAHRRVSFGEEKTQFFHTL